MLLRHFPVGTTPEVQVSLPVLAQPLLAATGHRHITVKKCFRLAQQRINRRRRPDSRAGFYRHTGSPPVDDAGQ